MGLGGISHLGGSEQIKHMQCAATLSVCVCVCVCVYTCVFV